MTNQTRTPAQIQSEIDALKAELDALPKHEFNMGDEVYLPVVVGPRTPHDHSQLFLTKPNGFVICHNPDDLIPAADLIPREEHERAVAEAKADKQKITACVACDYLITEYAIDTNHKDAPMPRRHICDYNGRQFRVTVERVDTPACSECNDTKVESDLETPCHACCPDETPDVKEAFNAIREATKGAYDNCPTCPKCATNLTPMVSTYEVNGQTICEDCYLEIPAVVKGAIVQHPVHPGRPHDYTITEPPVDSATHTDDRRWRTAKAAMQGIRSNSQLLSDYIDMAPTHPEFPDNLSAIVAKYAVEQADALLAALEQPTTTHESETL